MESNDFVECNPPHQTIPEYLNCKLFCHKDYIESSMMFICLWRGSSVYVDKVYINKSLSKKDQLLVERIMSDIINTNSSLLEEAYNIPLTSSFFLNSEIINTLIIGTKQS